MTNDTTLAVLLGILCLVLLPAAALVHTAYTKRRAANRAALVRSIKAHPAGKALAR